MPLPPTEEITLWLARWRAGDEAARDRLFATVQPYLTQLAAGMLRRERRDHTLEPNAVVNELYLRLLAGGGGLSFRDRAHFMAVSAQTMRRVLIDHARARQADKRGGVQQRVPLSGVAVAAPAALGAELIDLDEQLEALATADPRAARVVELRFFGGLREEDIAEVLQVSVITVKRDWKAARAWLAARLQ
jgi:RNA polymerase sigma factor (TIGR02999 family)